MDSGKRSEADFIRSHRSGDKNSQSHSRPGSSCSKPFLGFQDEYGTPTPPRMLPTINVDPRFFPAGLKPGNLIEIKGPENCGKTFMLTYFIAQCLKYQPSKKVVLIDTSQQFSMRNLMCILLHENPFFVNQVDKLLTRNEIVAQYPQLNTALDRLIYIPCKSADEFILAAVCENSMLKELIRQDPEIALIAVDTVDCYSFSEKMEKDASKDILSAFLRNSCQIPAICTTIKIPNDFQLTKPNDAVKPEGPWFSNFRMNPLKFTHTLSITNDKVSPATKNQPPQKTAYLRCNRRANMAGSGDNHCVKFSIFSDMLWVVPS